jgi:ABC-2 type transport system ATP-binding protein
MSTAVLKTANLKKTIGKRTIVSDISLELNAGEVFGFLGPNGAGKTTTIRMIVGLSNITEGNIFINGHSVRSEFRAAMRDVGCIVENPEMYKYMSGLDNLRLFAKLYEGVDQARIDEVVAIVGLERAIKDKVKTYSLGMKQRLGIAQAILHHPRLLILDEPTNGLDPAGIKAMRELLRGLAQNEGMTVFVSSHILGEMQQMCDRVGIINHGKMITVKTVDELIGLSQDSGKTTLLVRTGDNAKAAGVLTEMGVTNRVEADGVHVDTQKDNVPKIVAALAGAGIAVYGMDSMETQSLEDVFMKLTGEGEQS